MLFCGNDDGVSGLRPGVAVRYLCFEIMRLRLLMCFGIRSTS